MLVRAARMDQVRSSRQWRPFVSPPVGADGAICWMGVLDVMIGVPQLGHMQPRRIVFVIFDGFQSLDLAGPYEVFQHAGRLTGSYECEIVAPAAEL